MTDKKPQTLDEMMEEYDQERIAEIDAWEKNKPQWVKDKIEAERKREIELGIRDENGVLIVPETDDEDEQDEEDEDDVDE